jgi:hypothetical protein
MVYMRFITFAKYTTPKPRAIFTTTTPGRQELAMRSLRDFLNQPQ